MVFVTTADTVMTEGEMEDATAATDLGVRPIVIVLADIGVDTGRK